ncbi:MAG: phosphoserine phosphatase SerB [Mesorhizobium sp.]
MSEHVATLIGHPASRALETSLANSACDAIGASSVDWLMAGVACDVALPADLDPVLAEQKLREAVGDRPIDIVVQETAGRRKALLIADMDSTMIDQECIDELADEAGMKEYVAAITARSMNGEIAFEPALRERVGLLKGLPLSVIDNVLRERITLASGGKTLVATMRANGAWTALVSGGFTLFTGPVAARLGFDANYANHLNVDGDTLAGTVAEPILGREAKAQALTRFCNERGLDFSQTIAVGDGANDLDMLKLAGAGVALHAKPAVAAQARIRIDHGDLTALLFMQGYRESEFVA